MKILKQLSKRKIVDDVILVPIGDTSLKLKGLITLNETGEFLWDRLPASVSCPVCGRSCDVNDVRCTGCDHTLIKNVDTE